MGMYCTVFVSDEQHLPHFPDEIDRERMAWQSKSGLNVYAGPYRITGSGRLEQKKTSYREKTDVEKRAEAEKWGFESWDAYTRAYEEYDWVDDGKSVPEFVDWDPDEDGYEDTPPILGVPDSEVVDGGCWEDVSHHGTFEFHTLLQQDPLSYEDEELGVVDEYALDVYVEYEARFTDGDLESIVFVGRRGCGGLDGRESVIEEMREWAENRNA